MTTSPASAASNHHSFPHRRLATMKTSFNDFPGPITVSAALLLLLLLAETATAFVPFSTISVKNDGTARVNHHHQGVINKRGSSTRTYLDSLTPNMDNVNLIHHEHLVDGDEEDLDVDPLAAFISTSNEQDEEAKMDATNMRLAIQMAQSGGGERGATSPYPKPVGGAVIVTKSGKVLGKGRSDYRQDAVLAALVDAGLDVTPLREWVVAWPSAKQLREDLASSTMYLTLEPSNERQGESLPPMTQLIEQSGISRIVIGCAHPVMPTEGAATLHSAGLEVIMGTEQDDCDALITQYTILANSKLQKNARKHFERHGVPLGFLHCSVVDSDNKEAFARQGNAFGKDFGGTMLSSRDFGSYGLAPPPDMVWAGEAQEEEFTTDADNFFSMEFEDEDYQEGLGKNPMMPWYEQVDAVVATFPKAGNGQVEDDTIRGRLSGGLKWLATQGESLPANVERVLVMDATDLKDLPLSNTDPNLPFGVDIEAFWKSEGRKPTRILLRRGENAQAQAAAMAAMKAAEAAAAAAKAAVEAVESGDAANAAEAALAAQDAAFAATKYIQSEMAQGQVLKRKLTDQGVIIDTLSGGEPVDVMRHLGKRSGYHSVVWRAGCWGERGVAAILSGAFQWVSAHLAVDAVGGKFWQLMLAERAVQAACGPERKVKVFADQEDISLEYCDEEEADKDCVLTVDGRPVRHVRLDCRVALVQEDRAREFFPAKTQLMTKKVVEEEAPWFL